jgi:SAM-dependent methyltransferase
MIKFLKRVIKSSPALYNISLRLLYYIRSSQFPGTEQYWENRYRSGGTSGAGSYNRLAQFKADTINQFVAEKNITTVIDLGCGDGNNLILMNFSNYIGLDVSHTAIKICMDKFKGDSTKSFYLYSSVAFDDKQHLFNAQLTLSLDVIYHLIEDDLYQYYMRHLFAVSEKYVIIYSRLVTDKFSCHEKGRDFLTWIKQNEQSFRLVNTIENKYRYDPKDPHNTSDAAFYFFERIRN